VKRLWLKEEDLLSVETKGRIEEIKIKETKKQRGQYV
jgi:RNA-binding protein YlmH